MTVFFTADLHLGHKNLASNLRHFDDIDEHDDWVLSMFDSLNKRDKLFILGDITLHKSHLPKLKRIPCRDIDLILGNHDIFHMREYIPYFNHIYGAGDYKRDTVLSHYPLKYSAIHEQINLHGHCHENIGEDPCKYPLSTYIKEGVYLDIGIDMWQRPISFEEIEPILPKSKWRVVG